jgi:N utilization substance protein B
MADKETAAATEIELPENETREIRYDDLARREVRSIIFHLLYAMESFDYQVSLGELIDTFNRGLDLQIPMDSELFQTTDEIIKHHVELDEQIKPLLINWRFDRIGTCTKLILRYAIWELQHSDIPHSIIINEAIELAKCFSETDSYKFINGILDEAVKVIRPEAVEKESEEDAS